LGVKYFKRNFLPGRAFIDEQDLREQLGQSQAEIADVRIHGTTHRARTARCSSYTEATAINDHGLPRRGDPGRRDLRPPAAQRPSDRAKRTLAKKGGEARKLIDGPASHRSDHDLPIYVITIERSERSRCPKCAPGEAPRLSEPAAEQQGLFVSWLGLEPQGP
jgi:hypothetical protein